MEKIETEKKSSELAAEVDHYFRSGEINSDVKDQKAKVEKIKEDSKQYEKVKKWINNVNLIDYEIIEVNL